MTEANTTANIKRTLNPGDSIIYVTPTGKEVVALTTANWGPMTWEEGKSGPTINLAYVSIDPGMTDNYGRQLARESSVQHVSTAYAPGRYWRQEGEAPYVQKTPPAV